jgi:hypothetical protein
VASVEGVDFGIVQRKSIGIDMSSPHASAPVTLELFGYMYTQPERLLKAHDFEIRPTLRGSIPYHAHADWLQLFGDRLPRVLASR